MIKPSQAIAFYFGTQTPATGAAVNADSTPTAVVYRNGAVDVAVTPTVTNPATGSYKVAFTVPAGYAAGDIVEVLATATVGGVASPPTSVFLDSVDTVRESETYARIGANGAGLTALGDARLANLDATITSRSAAAALATLQGNITTILADYARRTGDYATVAALATLQGNVTTILADYARRTGDYSTLTAALVRAALGMAAADLDTQLDAILASEATPPTAGQIADAVWDEQIAGHLTAGSTGDALNNLVPGAPIEQTIEIGQTNVSIGS